MRRYEMTTRVIHFVSSLFDVSTTLVFPYSWYKPVTMTAKNVKHIIAVLVGRLTVAPQIIAF